MVRKILLALAAVGPGLFLIGYNIGTGSIATDLLSEGTRRLFGLLTALLGVAELIRMLG